MAVEVDGDLVTIDGVQVKDPVLADVVRSAGTLDEAVDLVGDALEIGARVMAREKVGVDVDYIRTELERMGEDLVQTIVDSFSSSDGKNPLADFKEGAVEAIRQMGSGVSEQLAGVIERSARLESVVESLRLERAAADELEAERERGTAKGREYEEVVLESVALLAGQRGDVCEGVGDTRGAGGRVGDVLVDIEAAAGPSRGRIVFEAKTGRLSRPEAMRELDRALEDRDADYAVLVVRDEQAIPARVSPLQEYDGNKMVAVLDPGMSAIVLEVAYALARARVLMGVSAGGEVDTVAVADAAQRALQALEDVRRVKSQLTSAAGNIESAKGILDSVVALARRSLEDLAALTTEADPPT